MQIHILGSSCTYPKLLSDCPAREKNRIFLKVFRYSFSDAIPIFFNRLKSGFFLVFLSLNSQRAFAQGVKIPPLFAFLAVRRMAICGKIVDYISGNKQFDVASATSNFKKIISKNISPFGRVETESENIWIC